MVKWLILSWFIVLSVSAAQCGPQPLSLQDLRQDVPPGEPNLPIPKGHAVSQSPNLHPVPLEAGEKLKVAATTNIIGDIARQVGGEAIDLTLLLPLGADPHTFTPSPRDVAAVAEARVVFINGLGLEAFLAELIANAGGEAVVVPVSQGVETRALEEDEGHEPDEAADHDHGEVDPHAWLSPANGLIFVRNIEAALAALDPANAAAYKANAEAYRAKLEELDAWVQAQIETIPAENRKLVTDHNEFGYYADRYGLELVGAIIPAYSTAAEPSAQELAELQTAMRAVGVKAVFVGTTVNPKLAEQVARDSGVKLAFLYTGSLGEVGSGVETYLDLIRYNTRAIVEALK